MRDYEKYLKRYNRMAELAAIGEMNAAKGAFASNSITKSNAFSLLINGINYILSKNADEPIDKVLSKTYIYCSAQYKALLMQDSTFVRSGNNSQELVKDGIKELVYGSHLVTAVGDAFPPFGSFIVVYDPTAPHKIEDGGTDDGVYYHKGQSAVLGTLAAYCTAGTSSSNTEFHIVTPKDASDEWFCITAEDADSLPRPTAGTAITPGTAPWLVTSLTVNEGLLSLTIGHKFIEVMRVGSDFKPISVTIIGAVRGGS